MIDERKKWSKQPPPALTASAVGPCPTIILISRTPGTATTDKCSDKYIGVGRFRIFGGGGGGQGLEYCRGARGPNSQQGHDVVMLSMRRNDVMPTRLLINQCQTITFLILKSDIIENSRIELKGIVLPAPLNHIKVTFIIILPFDLVHL